MVWGEIFLLAPTLLTYVEGTFCTHALGVYAGATRGVTSELCPALCRVMSADVPDDEVMRGGTETLTIHKRILKELQVEVSLNDSCYKHFQNWIYLCIIQGSSGAALHSRAGQGRGLSPTEFFVGQTGKTL